MTKDYDKIISKDLLFGKNLDQKYLKECGEQRLFGQTEEEGDKIFARTVHTLYQQFALVP